MAIIISKNGKDAKKTLSKLENATNNFADILNNALHPWEIRRLKSYIEDTKDDFDLKYYKEHIKKYLDQAKERMESFPIKNLKAKERWSDLISLCDNFYKLKE